MDELSGSVIERGLHIQADLHDSGVEPPKMCHLSLMFLLIRCWKAELHGAFRKTLTSEELVIQDLRILEALLRIFRNITGGALEKTTLARTGSAAMRNRETSFEQAV
jgi:hypothetical protein